MHQFLQSLNDGLIAGFHFEILVRRRQPSSRSTISRVCQIMQISRFRGLLLRFGIREYLGNYPSLRLQVSTNSWPVQR